jgi:hypothetical protein
LQNLNLTKLVFIHKVSQNRLLKELIQRVAKTCKLLKLSETGPGVCKVQASKAVVNFIHENAKQIKTGCFLKANIAQGSRCQVLQPIQRLLHLRRQHFRCSRPECFYKAEEIFLFEKCTRLVSEL